MSKVDRVVFPITTYVNNKVTFLGTAFFIQEFGGCVTAKHNLNYQDEDLTKKIVAVFRTDDNHLIPRKIMSIDFHESSVIAVCLLHDYLDVSSYRPTTNYYAKLDLATLQAKEQLTTYAYSNSTVKFENGSYMGYFKPDTYQGVFNELVTRDDQLIKGDIILTNMLIKSGASGGPVFNEKGNVVGVNSTGFDLGEGEEPISFVTPIKYALDIKIGKESKGAGFTLRECYEDERQNMVIENYH